MALNIHAFSAGKMCTYEQTTTHRPQLFLDDYRHLFLCLYLSPQGLAEQ